MTMNFLIMMTRGRLIINSDDKSSGSEEDGDNIRPGDVLWSTYLAVYGTIVWTSMGGPPKEGSPPYIFGDQVPPKF